MTVTLTMYLEYWTWQSYLNPFVLDVTLIPWLHLAKCYTPTLTLLCSMLHSLPDPIIINVTFIPGPPIYFSFLMITVHIYKWSNSRRRSQKYYVNRRIASWNTSNVTTIDQYRLRLFVCIMIIGTEKRYLDHTKVLANSVKKTHLVTKIFGNYQISEWNVWLQEMTLKDISLLFVK